ncbi:hypothetical protein [Paraburkholderia sp.]|nr:hypothetical protein [Paraburkholderia sp.]
MLSRSLLRATSGIQTTSSEFDTAGVTIRLTIAHRSRIDLATVPITVT